MAFFADGNGFAVPARYRMQAWVDGDWRDIAAPKGSPVANGVTDVRWPALRTARIRVAFTQHPGKAVRLAEFKLFED